MHHRALGLAGVAAVLFAAPALAHHSNAMFDFNKNIKLAGTVKQFQWTNPHSWLRIVVADRKGNLVEYALEMGAPGALVTKGWKPKTVAPGDKVTVNFYPTKDGGNGGSLRNITLPGGKMLGEEVHKY